jgi:hypothetical protein
VSRPPLVVPCGHCGTGHAHVVFYDGWVADTVHDATCPVLRDVPGMRASFEDRVLAELARVTPVADYGEDVVAVHTAVSA